MCEKNRKGELCFLFRCWHLIGHNHFFGWISSRQMRFVYCLKLDFHAVIGTIGNIAKCIDLCVFKCMKCSFSSFCSLFFYTCAFSSCSVLRPPPPPMVEFIVYWPRSVVVRWNTLHSTWTFNVRMYLYNICTGIHICQQSTTQLKAQIHSRTVSLSRSQSIFCLVTLLVSLNFVIEWKTHSMGKW